MQIRSKKTPLIIVIFTWFLFPVLIQANQNAELLTFQKEILPIFANKCLICHGKEPFQGELDLTSLPALLTGGISGTALVAGKSEQSLLIEKVVTGQMPPGESKLSSQEIEQIRNWINIEAPKEINRINNNNTQSSFLQLSKVSEQDVLPIFQIRCIACHGKRLKEGGLDLRTLTSRLKGGRSGPAIIPGKPAESLIIQKIESGEMPPVEMQLAKSVRPPNELELKILRRWISAGAPADLNQSSKVPRNNNQVHDNPDQVFWSFQPPVKPIIPKVVAEHLVQNPVDAFLLKKLESKGLTFSKPADPLKLLRRVYIDVLGMPPSEAEVESYLQDTSRGAYEQLIERLLSSKHYGERWGRYWLDLAGYSDSEGFGNHDGIRTYAWRYRDYVVRSFNQDKPYSQFLTEQIAGDELSDYKNEPITQQLIDRLAATGFLRTTPDPTDAPERGFITERMNIIADEVEVLSSAILGLTVQCARCHDHKYDPISQEDYYRLSAILHTSYDPYEWIPPKKRRIEIGLEKENQEVTLHNEPLKNQIHKLEKQLINVAAPFVRNLFKKRLEVLPHAIREEFEKLGHTPQGYKGPERLRKFNVLNKPQKETNSEINYYLYSKFKKTLEVTSEDLGQHFPEFKEKTGAIQGQLNSAKDKLLPNPYIRTLNDIGGTPSTTFLLKRGNPMTPGKPLLPGVPSILNLGLKPYQIVVPWKGATTSGRRLALARWLTQPNHPLTSRVIVNQIWLRYFGRGLVPTPSNFGHSGKPPTHPKLLDWLSTELVKKGWKIKTIHRLILTSSAYQQTSQINSNVSKIDPENILISRMKRGRMDAEALYDSILKVTGRLNPKTFGPPEPLITQPNNEITAKGSNKGFRRSIYSLQRRYDPLSLLEAYDLPRMTPNCLERKQSTVATQALHMMNGSTVWEHSRYMAGRIIDKVGFNLEDQIKQVYLRALSRKPTQWELKRGQRALIEFDHHWQLRLKKDLVSTPLQWTAHWQALAAFCHTILNSAEFSFID